MATCVSSLARAALTRAILPLALALPFAALSGMGGEAHAQGRAKITTSRPAARPAARRLANSKRVTTRRANPSVVAKAKRSRFDNLPVHYLTGATLSRTQTVEQWNRNGLPQKGILAVTAAEFWGPSKGTSSRTGARSEAGASRRAKARTSGSTRDSSVQRSRRSKAQRSSRSANTRSARRDADRDSQRRSGRSTRRSR